MGEGIHGPCVPKWAGACLNECLVHSSVAQLDSFAAVTYVLKRLMNCQRSLVTCHTWLICVAVTHLNAILKSLLAAVQLSSNTDKKVKAFRATLKPLRQTLQDFQWLGGEQISYADISVASQFLVSKHGHICSSMYLNQRAMFCQLPCTSWTHHASASCLQQYLSRCAFGHTDL